MAPVSFPEGFVRAWHAALGTVHPGSSYNESSGCFVLPDGTVVMLGRSHHTDVAWEAAEVALRETGSDEEAFGKAKYGVTSLVGTGVMLVSFGLRSESRGVLPVFVVSPRATAEQARAAEALVPRIVGMRKREGKDGSTFRVQTSFSSMDSSVVRAEDVPAALLGREVERESESNATSAWMRSKEARQGGQGNWRWDPAEKAWSDVGLPESKATSLAEVFAIGVTKVGE